MTKNGLELATQKHFELNSATESELRARFVNRLGGYINFIGQIRGKTDRNYTMFKSGFDRYFSEGV
jgi:RNA-directed DNA polymerase